MTRTKDIYLDAMIGIAPDSHEEEQWLTDPDSPLFERPYAGELALQHPDDERYDLFCRIQFEREFSNWLPF